MRFVLVGVACWSHFLNILETKDAKIQSELEVGSSSSCESGSGIRGPGVIRDAGIRPKHLWAANGDDRCGSTAPRITAATATTTAANDGGHGGHDGHGDDCGGPGHDC